MAGRAGELESAKHRAEATADQLRAEGDWRSRVRNPLAPSIPRTGKSQPNFCLAAALFLVKAFKPV